MFFFLPYTPTELQVSSSCNMTNQPLFLRNNPAVEAPFSTEPGLGWWWWGGPEPDRLRGRKGADGQRVCLQLGFFIYFIYLFF